MFKKMILLALGIVLILLIGGYFWWQNVITPVSKEGVDKIFIIKRGEVLDSIGVRLQNEGLIKSAIAFKIYAYQTDLKDKIQSGDFKLNPSLSMAEIAQTLTHGSIDIWVTFLEGWRREEFAQKLIAEIPGFDSKTFLDLTKSQEGRLFPDTYLLPKGATPTQVVDLLVKNFNRKYSTDLQQKAQKQNLTENQVLILASILERESKAPDREIVAGIILKRLRSDWPLQVDATVQYAVANEKLKTENGKLADWWPQVSRDDLKIESAYNTYTNKGLPPAPICNPSLDSIEAVISSEESEYWFYLTGTDGKMHYGKTAEEHQENINQYLR